mmetsp:Transcript_9410/g.20056  ORF Transcript_9410/g.20056 Transcript_9410/m.20056 type:complete len:228 (-) Transcript_9410:593-1276(-)|eukprot:CAMPEP_0202891310 /NCGR_PEP_ID=MMETSP1392-20130828/1404_1 /ASSEMBLY_ACC=CAM_ASM_000868 /TAXON_ID=225041 /ORGANISM="Chlamydomonas chlamydogama, Strain SAG 11-48b" /LENGTH=227 /DNA_ID=CAMNT_0049575023 /DNA_START=100 /DNA_END=783 /DNA_ORIENTATION=-
MVTEEVTFDSALTRLKKLVYKNRIRMKEFIVDFDKLRSGFVHPNHFLTALSMAGVDKALTPAEMQVICDTYTVPRSPSLIMVDYKTFLDDVDVIFTVPHLEKTPLADVTREPTDLLDKTRYVKASRVLSSEKEAIVSAAIQRLADIVARRGTPVKPFFDDAAANDHSAKLYGHVTVPQFRQCLSTKLELYITEDEAKALVEKFANEDKPDLVNYIAFSCTIDPPMQA